MATATPARTTPAFVSARAAYMRLGMTQHNFLKMLASRGGIRTQMLPGVPVRYCLADVERVGRELAQEGAELAEDGGRD